MREVEGEHRPEDLRALFCHGGFFVVRTALLPFAELERLGGRSSPDERGDCAERLAAAGAGLARSFERTELREALFFASANLDGKLDREGARAEALEHTLARYFTRSCTRATPFGLFAGVSLGRVAATSRLEIGPLAAYRRYTRPSAAFLGQLLSRAAARAEPSDALRYAPNPSSYRAWGRIRFSREGADGKSHPVVDVEPAPALERALACAAPGATLEEIARAIAAPGTDLQRALVYARALVEHAILVPSWLPTITGLEPSAAAWQSLEGHPALGPVADLLKFTSGELARLDAEPIGQSVSGLRGVARALGHAADALGFEGGNVLQADLIKPAPALSIDAALAARFLEAARLVQRTGAVDPNEDLAEFRRRFTQRYATQWVPLVEALDGDLGIGFGEQQRNASDALVHGFGLDARPPVARAVSALDELRLNLLNRALQSAALEVSIDAGLLERFPRENADDLPESFAVLAQLGCRDGRYTIVDPIVIAPSGVATMARFCHADPDLERAVREHAALEQERAGARLLADVAYLPPGDTGNILARPVLRAVEIAYAGKSGASHDRQIPISDLYVSVVAEKVQLYSRRFRRPIAIRINNALDHAAWQHLPIYRFLGALQDADREGLPATWSWGALDSSQFLPRVTCGNVVLCRARWLLTAADIAPLEGLTPTRAFAWVQGLRERLRLPRWIVVSGAETPLVVDLESSPGVELFSREVRRTPHVVFHELLPAPDELAVTGPEGKFVSEVIVPFVLRRSPLPPPATSRPNLPDLTRRSTVRSFAPGSQWLYAKIYSGPSLLDALVQRVALELVPSLPTGTLALWFFVPYSDGESHVRLRFLGDPRALLTHVLPALERLIAPHRDTGAIYRLQLDTYERELERYGGEQGIELAERAFHWDSEAAARVLEMCADSADRRWELTLLGVDRLLADFVPKLDERASVAEAILTRSRQALAVNTRVLKAIGTNYRARAGQIGELLWPGGAIPDPPGDAERARRIYAERSERLVSIIERLELLAASGQVEVERMTIAESLVHMHVIRMLGTRARLHEVVIYDFLRRQYVSRLARTSGTIRSEVG